MIIGLDMDGVLVDFLAPIRERWNLEHHQFTQWDFKQFDFHKEIYDFFHQPNYFRNLQPFPGARYLVDCLSDKHEVWLCTSATPKGYAWGEKLEWVQEYMPKLADRLIIAADKSRCVFDLFVDDRPKNLHTNKSDYRLLFDQPYNQEDDWLVRVYSYEHLLYEIKERS